MKLQSVVMFLFVVHVFAEQTRTYYDILGVPKDASTSQIKSTFRTLARKYHPDKFKGNEKQKEKAQAKFMEMSQAAEVLSDEQKRKEYDQSLLFGGGQPGQGAPGGGGAHFSGFSGSPHFSNSHVHVQSMEGLDLSKLAEMFGAAGGQFGGGNGQWHFSSSQFPSQGQGGRRPQQTKPKATKSTSSRTTTSSKADPKASSSRTSSSSSSQKVPNARPPTPKQNSTECPLACNGVKCARKC
eukprot:c7924_g1_i1.p1 GENE.c7924_g1_i1~~c7924_g1_i1.p1  ORF type:complete len:240 (-),score=45.94 c7924_g1_i1:88-807(-)